MWEGPPSETPFKNRSIGKHYHQIAAPRQHHFRTERTVRAIELFVSGRWNLSGLHTVHPHEYCLILLRMLSHTEGFFAACPLCSSCCSRRQNCSDARGPGVVGRVQHDNSGCFFAPTAQGGGCAMIRLRVRITYAPKRTTWEQHLEYHFRLAQKAPFSENCWGRPR